MKKEFDNPEEAYKPEKKDLRAMYEFEPRFCKVCGKRLHAKQDKFCSRQCLAKGRY